MAAFELLYDLWIVSEVFVGVGAEANEIKEVIINFLFYFCPDAVANLFSSDNAHSLFQVVKDQFAPVLLFQIDQVREGDVREKHGLGSLR